MSATVKTTLLKELDKLSSMHDGMEHKSIGDQLQIIRHLLKAMKTSTGALSLPNTGSASLFLSLSAATIGIHSTKSQAGIIGPSLEKVIEALSKGIVVAILPHASLAEQHFLKMLCTVSYAMLLGIAAKVASKGIGQFSREMEEVDLKAVRFFSFELALRLMNSSLGLKGAFKVIIEACGGNSHAQELGAKLLAGAGNLLVILAGANEGKKPATYLIDEERKYIRETIQAALALIAKEEEEDTGTLDPTVTVALNQLNLSLEKNREDEFMVALDSLLESIGTSVEALQTDIETLRKQASMVLQTAHRHHDEESLTGIINVI